MKAPSENLEAFLRELSRLSRKYGVFIRGCGCCGSPEAYDEENGVGVYELTFDRRAGQYKYTVTGG